MPKPKNAFWNHYAKANDDIRTELIDKAWLGNKTGSTEFQDHIRQQENTVGVHGNNQGKAEATQHAALYGQDSANTGLQGIGVAGDENSNWQTTKEAVHSAQGAHPPQDAAIHPDAQNALAAQQRQFEGLNSHDPVPVPRHGGGYETGLPSQAEPHTPQMAGQTNQQHHEGVYGLTPEQSGKDDIYGQQNTAERDDVNIYGNRLQADEERSIAELYGYENTESESGLDIHGNEPGKENDVQSLYGYEFERPESGPDIYGHELSRDDDAQALYGYDALDGLEEGFEPEV